MNEDRVMKMFNDYEDIITTGLDYDYSTKEIYDAIYKKEMNLYIRRGIEPRVDELRKIAGFCEYIKAERNSYNDYTFLTKSDNKEEKSKPKNIEDRRLEFQSCINLTLIIMKKIEKCMKEEWEFIEEEGKGKANRLGYVYDDSHKPDPHRTVCIGFDMDQA